MKVLLISGCFFPTKGPRAFRTTELAKELAIQGHLVTVMFPTNGFDYKQIENDLGISILDIPLKWSIFKSNKLIFRILNRLLLTLFEFPDIEYLFRLPKLFSKLKEYDLLVSIAVPHPIHWAVARYIKKNQRFFKTWIADCGDPFMFARLDSFNKLFYFKYFEKQFCKRADFITIPIKEGIAGYYPEYHSKIKIVPQGFNFEEIKINNYSPNSIPTFAFAGSFILRSRDPRPVLEFLLTVECDFRFWVFTMQPEYLDSYKFVLGEKLIVSSFIPRLDLIKKLSTFDFLLNLENGTNIQSPSKLIDYALTKRPILSLYSQDLDKGKFLQYLSGNYDSPFVVKNIDSYNIKNVAKYFIELALLDVK